MGLIGRGVELRRLTELIDEPVARVITLVGVGGSGKTTLARAAASTSAFLPGEVVWVDLAEVREPALAVSAVCVATQVQAESGQLARDVLCETLGTRAALLVLDNCEHVLTAVQDLLAVLLACCPALVVLATSREPLGVAGEHPVVVDPLTVPDESATRPEDLEGIASVELFVARAAAADPSFQLTAATAGAVARLCIRVDGLPLALELLAARLGSMPIEELLGRLDAGVDDLSDGDDLVATEQGRHERHTSIRASMGWAYQLLTDTEQLLLRRLSVFAGGWTRALAIAVCSDELLPPDRLADAHERLERRSMIQPVDPYPEVGAPRHRMLEPVRDHAQRQLVACDGSVAASRRFATAYLELVERELPDRAWTTSPSMATLQRLGAEHANLLAAIHAAERDGGLRTALTLATRLWVYWRIRGHLMVGRLLMERLLVHVDLVEPAVATDAILAAAAFAQTTGDLDGSEGYLGRALVRCRQLDDQVGYDIAVALLANICASRGDHQRAVTLYQQVLDRGRDRELPFGQALVLTNLGLTRMERAEFADARAVLEEAESLLGEAGDVWFRAYVLTCLGRVAHHDGDLPCEHDHILRSTRLLIDHGGGPELAEAMEHLARLEADFGNLAASVQLYAAARRARERSGCPLPLARAQAAEGDIDELRRLLGPAVFGRLWAAGSTLTPDRAIMAARGGRRRRQGPLGGRRGTAWPLTPRELEIADAVAQGMTNRDIGALLGISPGTVKTHVQNALSKLGFGSRTELGIWATRRSDEVRGPDDIDLVASGHR